MVADLSSAREPRFRPIVPNEEILREFALIDMFRFQVDPSVYDYPLETLQYEPQVQEQKN